MNSDPGQVSESAVGRGGKGFLRLGGEDELSRFRQRSSGGGPTTLNFSTSSSSKVQAEKSHKITEDSCPDLESRSV